MSATAAPFPSRLGVTGMGLVTSVGWNANSYVAPSLTGRTRRGKALVAELTARTAQSRAEQATQDERTRKRHGLGPKVKPAVTPKAGVSQGGRALANEARKRAKARGTAGVAVTVVKRKRRKL